VTPLDALYTDLDNLGKIFGVEKRADELVTGLKDRVTALKKTWPAGTTRQRCSSTTRAPTSRSPPAATPLRTTSSPRPAAPTSSAISTRAGRRWAGTGHRGKPEVIVIIDYADQPAKDKIAYLKSLPSLKSIPAVKDNHFLVMSYGDAVSGPRNVTERRPGPLPALGRTMTVTPARIASGAPGVPVHEHITDAIKAPDLLRLSATLSSPARDTEGVRRPRRRPHPAARGT